MAIEGGLLSAIVWGGLLLASGVTLFAAARVIVGPTVPDRVVALDTISSNVLAIAALYAIFTDRGLFVLVGLVLAIIGFVSTIAVARFVTEGDIIE